MAVKRKAALVTGATGFLGRRLCERLQSEGERVIALGRRESAGPWDSFIECDLSRSAPTPEDLSGVSIIYHLASKAHAVSETVADIDSYRPVIVEGTRRLLEAALKAEVETFIYMSSVKAMGEGNPVDLPLCPLDETWPHTPQSPYGLAKAEAEQIVIDSGIQHACVLRPVMIFGPGEKGNLPRMIEAIRKDRFPPLPETGNRRSMIHVNDVVELAIRAAQRPIAAGRIYILAPAEAPSTRQLYDAIRASLGQAKREWSIPESLLKAAAGMGTLLGNLLNRRMPLDLETLHKLTGSAWYSGEKARKELGYSPKHSVTNWLKDGD